MAVVTNFPGSSGDRFIGLVFHRHTFAHKYESVKVRDFDMGYFVRLAAMEFFKAPGSLFKLGPGHLLRPLGQNTLDRGPENRESVDHGSAAQDPLEIPHAGQNAAADIG